MIKIAELPKLTIEEAGDASFRLRDRLWASVGDLFDAKAEEEGLTFAAVGRRIGRSRSQVQRWLASPTNMTSASAGLLAEGLDAEFVIHLEPRSERGPSNYIHPCEDARVFLTEVLAKRPEVELFSAAPATSAPRREPRVASGWRSIHAG